MRNIIVICALCIVSFLGCARYNMAEMTQLDLERVCFDSVKAQQWTEAEKFCKELVIVDDYHFGGWGQLCIAGYHLGKVEIAYEYCRYALKLGSDDDRVIHAYAEIEIVVADKFRQENLKSQKKKK
jgi:hypothetical protein